MTQADRSHPASGDAGYNEGRGWPLGPAARAVEGGSAVVLRDVLRWWWQQMASLLPSGHARSAADAVVVRARGDLAVELSLRRHGVRQPLGAARLDEGGLPQLRAFAGRHRSAGRVVLELPASLLLEQQASLPLAAEAALGEVLTHEMDRLTPFRAADVFWSWAVAGRDTVNGRLLVRLSIVLKAAVAPLVQGLAQAGLAPTTLELPAPDGGLRRLGLLPPGVAGSRQSRAVRVAAGACAALAVAAAVIPLVQQQWAFATVESQIDALQPRVALAEGLRRRLAASSNAADLFAAESARSGNAVLALAAVTRALPDDTYLTEFTLQGRKLTLGGRSEAAVRLIGVLASEPALANPAFAAPVFRTIGDHGDQFTISADLAP